MESPVRVAKVGQKSRGGASISYRPFRRARRMQISSHHLRILVPPSWYHQMEMNAYLTNTNSPV